ncbi:MAG: c-type cytochrome [Planctomycetota bacterium]|jgi:YVTN family beta-propeller protein
MNATVILLVVSVQVVASVAAGATGDYLSPLEVAADSGGQVLYIAEATAGQVAVFDVASNKVTRTISLPAPVGGLALARDGSRLYATGAVPEGRAFLIDLQADTGAKEIPVGHTPGALAPGPDGKKLYVCNRFNNDISVIDLATGVESARIAVPREPAALAITADGRTLFVGNHLPAGVADGSYAAAEVSVIDTASRKVVQSIQLPNGSMALRDITISPDGKYAYATHILARYQLPTTQLERGWMNTNALTIIDVANRRRVNTVLLDDVDRGAANPWSVVCTADGKYICTTIGGTHELMVIDRDKLHDKLGRVASGQKVSDASSSSEDVPNDLSFLVGLKRRVKLTGLGPRGLAVIGTRAYVTEYFSDSLGTVDIDPEVRPRARSVKLGPDKPLTAVRQGEIFFHDAALCFQKWQSCSSCHPGDARVDALNWDLLNDGLGNPKNTRSLLLAHRTPPSMSLAVRSTAEEAVRAGIRHIQFAVRPEEDAVAIDEYLRSLKPIPSPYLVNGALSERARRGKQVFESAGCSSCHSTALHTDGMQYNVGTGKLLDEGKEFDTPTLVEVWRTAPYLHDGRARTIVDVFKKHNPRDDHGQSSDLTEQQLADLAEYVLSL